MQLQATTEEIRVQKNVSWRLVQPLLQCRNKPEVFGSEGYTWQRPQWAMGKDGRSKALSVVSAVGEECKFCAVIVTLSSKGSGRIFRIFLC